MRSRNNRRSLHLSGRRCLVLVMAVLALCVSVASTKSSATRQPLSERSVRGAGSVAPAVAGGAQDAISQVAGGCTTPRFIPAPGSPFGAGDGPYSVAIGDFNRDGKQDLAVANADTDDVSVLLNNANTPPTAYF